MNAGLQGDIAAPWWSAAGWSRTSATGRLWVVAAFGAVSVSAWARGDIYPVGLLFCLVALCELGGYVIRSGRIRNQAWQRRVAYLVRVLIVLALVGVLVMIVHGVHRLIT